MNKGFEKRVCGSLEYLVATHFEKAGFAQHMFTTRRGGVSGGSLASLNLGLNRPEKRENILENYKIACACLGQDYTKLILPQQVHSTNIHIATKADMGCGITSDVILQTDGLILAEHGMGLGIFYADCVPILLCDPVQRVVAAVHAGWRGTVGGIAGKAVAMMMEKFLCKAENILAAIGPSIGPCHFEVGREVAEAFLCADMKACVAPKGEKYRINLWQANTDVLIGAGLAGENICCAMECTCCHDGLYFSHRGCGSDTGRMAALIFHQ